MQTKYYIPKKTWHDHVFQLNNLVALFIAVGAIMYSFYATEPSNAKQIVFVEKGTSTEDFLGKLQEKGLIKNRVSYGLAYVLTKISGNPEPGAYYFKYGMSALAIASKVKEPDYKYVSIQEGWRKEQIASAFAKALDWNEEKEKNVASKYPACPIAGREGYLFPGDYLVSVEATPQSIMEEMELKFDETFSDITSIKNGSVVFDEEQIVKIASLIQREAGGKSDMRIISGIIWNRILTGMPLQIDATLQYAKGEDGNWWPVPKSEDKFIDSPYNTYQNEGLPPTPIANPGEAALAAALNPAQTSCIFYLHDKWGNIHCTSTYKGHLDNIKRYL